METAQVPEHEACGLSSLLGAIGQTEVPEGICLPAVALEELVLVGGGRLYLGPLATHHVLASRSAPRPWPGLVDEVFGHGSVATYHPGRAHKPRRPSSDLSLFEP